MFLNIIIFLENREFVSKNKFKCICTNNVTFYLGNTLRTHFTTLP